MFNYPLTARCLSLREKAIEVKERAKPICMQNAYWSKFGRNNAPEGCENILICAYGIASVMENSTPLIYDDDLFAGYNFGDGEYWGYTGNIEIDKQRFIDNGFSEKQIEEFYNCPNRSYNYTPQKYPLTDNEMALLTDYSVTNSAGQGSITANHSIIGYEKVVKYGFSGLLDEVNSYAEKNGESDFYRALRLICEASFKYGENYSKAAEKAGRNDIAEICRNVPKYGAKSFREAIQAFWFAHIINTWEDDINANSLGRLDQIFYPYYKHDIDNNIITREEAFEMICCLWIKLYRNYDVQQSSVGGRGHDGVSQINELSYMMLDATEQLDFVRCLSVRFDGNTDKKFVKRALEVVGHTKKGIPFFFNDDVIIPALIDNGILPVDACDYSALGCVEICIPGKANPHAVNSRCNVLKALEYALFDGYSNTNKNIMPGIITGKIETFDELYAAVEKQLVHMIKSIINIAIKFMAPSEINDPKPVKSLLTEGCMEKGIDFNARGSMYDYYQLMLIGIPNLADSLAAINEIVYQKKLYTLKELIYQLENNWENEVMRLEFKNNAPKYGNDDDRVDILAFKLTDFMCDIINEESNKTGYNFQAQPFSYLWMLDHGRVTAASPDGRKNGEALAYSVSPMQGRDKEGLTAVFNSITKLPTKKAPGTASAIIEIEPELFEDKNIIYLTDILIAAAKNGLSNVQFNTVDVETLKNAQKNPELYQNLAVRVSGYSQKFNLLSRELQDHIIARTKHKAL